ncbi:MAG: glutamate synthase large subunit [Deltaproteobacteria bacterium]|nr:glutamate synthase large subunit [Deltaproteobacteria bacterium]
MGFEFKSSVDRDACGVGFLVDTTGEASHEVIKKAQEALANLAHRGAIDADGKTGDGAGILTEIPKQFYLKKASEQGVNLAGAVDFAVAMVFFPPTPAEKAACLRVMRSILRKYELRLIWHREVPIDPLVLGKKAASILPEINQMFLACPLYMTLDEFDDQLFLVRKEIEYRINELSYDDFYIASLSSRTIVHKGLFMGADLCSFYQDLKDEDFASAFAVFHQRFSTNTFPAWKLAQPFRLIAHNGEINTIRGNRNWMRAREFAEQARIWLPEKAAATQLMSSGMSDSGSFDNACEAYVNGGRSVLHSLLHMMPQAWQNQQGLDEHLYAFYEYHSCVSEHWGGPAAIAFADRQHVGAIVDRNGLRPARFKVTDRYLLVCSEMGCVEFPDESVIANGRLGPGKIIAYNLRRRKILFDQDIKLMLADQKPYKDWVDRRVIKVDEKLKAQGKSIYAEADSLEDQDRQRLLKVFGYTQEDLDFVLKPMMNEGKEPLGSMGDDTPLAVFSEKPRLLYAYFKQAFAQVTNPPIDPIRERYTTSLRMYLGRSGNIYEETPKHALQLRVRGPIVTSTVFDMLRHHPDFPSETLMTRFSVAQGPEALEDILLDLCLAAERAVDSGKVLIILSDRFVNQEYAPIPMLLAVAAVHNHLMREGKRLKVSILVETAEARETHHFACLIGFGASVIYPYLALSQVKALSSESDIAEEQAVKNYVKASEKGLLKIMAKMGISVLQAYHAAQIFEAVGLHNSLIKRHFVGTPSVVSGATLADIASDYLSWHQIGYADLPDNVLEIGGHYRYRRDGERHAFDPKFVKLLQKAVTDKDQNAYNEYSSQINARPPLALRDLIKLKDGTKQIKVEAVEAADVLIKRFCTPGISYGALSKEAHETLAVAMNRLGAKSDSGEGGEDPERFTPLENGDSKNSAIKQIASGRFGVTTQYAINAEELEIKIAQGAKPGEGGQLPGHKVSVEIAKVRHSTPGVTLISPPPHHDIYSIEDLAQLIYDLKQVNPGVRVCVKLVAETGVGTIAAGVAKAHADVILISGHDGGTGASPLGSIKNAGLPWEIGLAETHQVLLQNGLRSRVTLRTDGGLKTGLDVVKAALLGAEEFGFGTAAMIAVGCVMVRKCHLNICPVGVATQDPELRKKFPGTPERVVHLFQFIAEEVREIMAKLGVSQFNELIGRSDLLEQIKCMGTQKAQRVNLSKLLYFDPNWLRIDRHCKQDRNDWLDDQSIDDFILRDCQDLFDQKVSSFSKDYAVRNVHRSLGAKLSGKIVKTFGPTGLAKESVVLNLTGTVGQSFGAFGAHGLRLNLRGEANDYVGKALSGASIVIAPPIGSRFVPQKNIICGNTCLYGATSGDLFANGRAGERFAVRNSGAVAVVEGLGDHGCEYMTGGLVLVLGGVGYNFGAGMTGGFALVYDAEDTLLIRHNRDDVEVQETLDWDDPMMKEFVSLLERHQGLTGSPLATEILQNLESHKIFFKLVVPKETRALEAQKNQKTAAQQKA